MIGERLWYIVGCYLANDEASTIDRIVAAVVQRPRGSKLLVAVCFNADLASPEGAEWDEEITAAL